MPSKRYRARRIALLLTCAVFVFMGFLVALFWYLDVKEEMEFRSASYQGKAIDEWFTELPLTIPFDSSGTNYLVSMNLGWDGFLGLDRLPSPFQKKQGKRAYAIVMGHLYGNTNQTSTNIMAAFNAMGTHSSRFLMWKLVSSDPKPENILGVEATKMGVKKIPFKNARLERLQAVTGLVELETMSAETEARLQHLSTNSPDKELADLSKFILDSRVLWRDRDLSTNDTSSRKGYWF